MRWKTHQQWHMDPMVKCNNRLWGEMETWSCGHCGLRCQGLSWIIPQRFLGITRVFKKTKTTKIKHFKIMMITFNHLITMMITITITITIYRHHQLIFGQQSERWGLPISGVAEADTVEGVKVYHAGTKQNESSLVTSGGWAHGGV